VQGTACVKQTADDRFLSSAFFQENRRVPVFLSEEER
jgi:hypothetical protein